MFIANFKKNTGLKYLYDPTKNTCIQVDKKDKSRRYKKFVTCVDQVSYSM